MTGFDTKLCYNENIKIMGVKIMNSNTLVMFCNNCKNKLILEKAENGNFKCQCGVCGMKIKITPISRRCLTIECFSPKGYNFFFDN